MKNNIGFSEKITFVVFTFNEQARIERVLRNLSGYGHVLVVDNHSTDGTRAICEKYNVEVLSHKNPGWVEDENTVALIKNTVRTPWIYWGFADEMLDEKSLAAIIEAVNTEKYRIISIARKNYYYGKFCHDAYADRLNRVFQKDALDFSGNKIHSFGRTTVSEDKICYLDEKKYYVRHFISNTAKIYLGTIDRYTDIQCEPAADSGGLMLFARMAKNFMKNYLIGGAYKAGRPGLFLVLQMMYYQCLLVMKSNEKKNQLDVLKIEEINNVERDKILQAIKK